MNRKHTRPVVPRPEQKVEKSQHLAVQNAIAETFTPCVVDRLRAQTGYNPRQRQCTAFRLLLIVVEAFLKGHSLSFASLRADFVRRFGFIHSCAFQNRLKQPSAPAFFREALCHFVDSVAQAAGLTLGGPLQCFRDVLVYDATSQHVPPRGKQCLPACTQGKAGAKLLVSYSIKTGLIQNALCDAQTTADLPLWRRLVPALSPGVLYLLDLGFFERKMFRSATDAGAHVLMRLKSTAKVQVLGHTTSRGFVPLPGWSLSYYLRSASKRRGTLFELDVAWGAGNDRIVLRLVGYAHKCSHVRWYLTTVPRHMLKADLIVQAYRLR